MIGEIKDPKLRSEGPSDRSDDKERLYTFFATNKTKPTPASPEVGPFEANPQPDIAPPDQTPPAGSPDSKPENREAAPPKD